MRLNHSTNSHSRVFVGTVRVEKCCSVQKKKNALLYYNYICLINFCFLSTRRDPQVGYPCIVTLHDRSECPRGEQGGKTSLGETRAGGGHSLTRSHSLSLALTTRERRGVMIYDIITRGLVCESHTGTSTNATTLRPRRRRNRGGDINNTQRSAVSAAGGW